MLKTATYGKPKPSRSRRCHKRICSCAICGCAKGTIEGDGPMIPKYVALKMYNTQKSTPTTIYGVNFDNIAHLRFIHRQKSRKATTMQFLVDDWGTVGISNNITTTSATGTYWPNTLSTYPVSSTYPVDEDVEGGYEPTEHVFTDQHGFQIRVKCDGS